MKTFPFILLLMASLAFVLVGCSDRSVPISGLADQTASAVSSSGTLGKMGTEVHSVTGTAHWKIAGTQTQVRFSFSAIQHADGSFSGEVRDLDEGPQAKIKGKVYDLELDGNRAKICFTTTSGFLAFEGQPTVDLTGWPLAFVVVDNGQGKSSTGPDLVSWIEGAPPGGDFNGMKVEDYLALSIDDFINAELSYYGVPLEVFMPPIDKGSVQVR